MSLETAPCSRRAASGLPDVLRSRAQAAPDRIAAVHEHQSLTFAELVARSERVDALLRQAGVGRDSRVGVFMEPSLDLLTGVWGILMSGGCYVPLSPEYPEERIAYMLADAGVDVALTQENLRPAFQELAPAGVRVLTLDGISEAADENAPAAVRPDSGVRPDDLAYVIYTSGSTGKPKGVMVEHHSIMSQMEWLHDECGIDERETVLQKTPMSFDAAQWELLAPACGSTVVMGAPGIYRDPEAIIATIERHGVTTLQCVPTLLQALLDTEKFPVCRTLRRVFSGGEALSRSLAAQCLDTMPDASLVNLYGPTECTINASSFTVDRAVLEDGPLVMPIGTPVRDTTLHVLNPDGEPGSVLIQRRIR
ncbi:AMP-binding protein [Streptomyces sp. NPDC048106]|uniref:AMP-binding protein n=1 Tax=Streptomyces sp. NPDC048106 TaxID=3155750 RepID=UPI003456FF82